MTTDGAERARRGLARWCAKAETAHELFEGASRRLRPILGFDLAAWLTTDPQTVLFTDAYIEGWPPESCSPWFHHELTVPDVALFRDMASARRPTAILSEAVDGDLASSARWRDLLEPMGYGRELRVVFRENGTCWGVASLLRNSASPDFTPPDAELLASISWIVASGLRRIVLRQQALPPAPDGPGLLLVGPDHVARPVTQAGERWLERLGLPEGGRRNTALLTLGELVTGGGSSSHRIRLRTRTDQWVTLHAEPRTDEAQAFAVIVEPSRPAEIAGLVALAYGLSPRETELVLALARGEGTDVIADRLCISTHTVRDHVKSIFGKTDVSSRNELVARLFHDHYADEIASRNPARG